MGKHIKLFTNELQNDDIYKLMVSSIIPRPIAWVTTKNRKGENNLAPFSFFTVASRNPPTLAFSIGPDERKETNGKKDTLKNIEETKEYIIHIPNQDLVPQVLKSSRLFQPDEDEIQQINLKTVSGSIVDVPMLVEVPVSFEIKLRDIIKIGSDHLVLGEIQVVHIKDELYLDDYKVDSEKLDPVSSVINQFAGMTNIFMPNSNMSDHII